MVFLMMKDKVIILAIWLKIFIFWILLCLSSSANAATRNDIELSVYLKAYPEHIKAIRDNHLIWKDGTEMPIKIYPEARPIEQTLKDPDLYSQISIPYPIGPLKHPPKPTEDPGRIRYVPFFQKMYGKTEEQVLQNLVEIDWMPRTFSGSSSVKLPVTKINHISEIMTEISKELDELVQKKPEYKKYLEDPGGTFSWRFIAGTNRPSAHSFGMTIDINVKYSAYWLWDYKKRLGLPLDANVDEADITAKEISPYRNEIPWDIVEIFEKHHFIWGGKWFHYDTMHFEYRPELFLK